MMCFTMSLSELRLGICLRRVTDGGAPKPSALGGNEAESPSSVDENRVALLDFVRLVHERCDRRCQCTKPAVVIRVSI